MLANVNCRAGAYGPKNQKPRNEVPSSSPARVFSRTYSSASHLERRSYGKGRRRALVEHPLPRRAVAAHRIRAHEQEPAHAALDARVHQRARPCRVHPVKRLHLRRIDGPRQMDHGRHAFQRRATAAAS